MLLLSSGMRRLHSMVRDALKGTATAMTMSGTALTAPATSAAGRSMGATVTFRGDGSALLTSPQPPPTTSTSSSSGSHGLVSPDYSSYANFFGRRRGSISGGSGIFGPVPPSAAAMAAAGGGGWRRERRHSDISVGYAVDVEETIAEGSAGEEATVGPSGASSGSSSSILPGDAKAAARLSELIGRSPELVMAAGAVTSAGGGSGVGGKSTSFDDRLVFARGPEADANVVVSQQQQFGRSRSASAAGYDVHATAIAISSSSSPLYAAEHLEVAAVTHVEVADHMRGLLAAAGRGASGRNVNVNSKSAASTHHGPIKRQSTVTDHDAAGSSGQQLSLTFLPVEALQLQPLAEGSAGSPGCYS